MTAIDSYPHNLGEGKLITMEENDIYYYKGVAYGSLGNEEEATAYLIKATQGLRNPNRLFL
ncbi:hypothetical protein KUH03_20235 [Sphingobacterium sp. E70]|uniref:hypothetical protein n=1 Tax=Sphingobacterium sp. E70 TaxID=2853439 RepID=UPI00211CAB66|nr:hypothetical protein [Sphingobacterium sp. E70]ULT28621.1 hypothetical protein KUH03_20235 [Sphingobacterium sp. E70]